MKKYWSQFKEKIESFRQVEDGWKIAGVLAVTVVLFGTGLVELGQLSKHTAVEVATGVTTETEEIADGTTESAINQKIEPPEVPELHAGAAALMDADSGRILYEKNGYEKKAMASTTKIMTCILALEIGNPEDVVTFSKNAAAQPDVQMNGAEGEQYYLKDLLYSLMLESHNDTAVAIAEHIGGSVEAFAELMNEKAQEIGAFDTNFVTPNGLDAPGHQTTACDLAGIAGYAIQNPEFLEIIRTPAHTFQELQGKRTVSVVNKDAFLTSYDGALGIKTGFTGEAGYCFVGAARRGEKTLITVVLASGWPPHKTYKWEDTRHLMDYGMAEYEKQIIVTPEQAISRITVLHGQGAAELNPEIRETVQLLVRAGEDIQVKENLITAPEAPIAADTVVGTLDIYINGVCFRSLPVYAGSDVQRLTYSYVLKELIYQYFLNEDLQSS